MNGKSRSIPIKPKEYYLQTEDKKMNKTKKLTFNKTTINWQRNAKYLGVYLDAKLNWQRNTKYMADRARTGIAKLHRLINIKSKLKPKLKLLLYKSIIRPVITYASPAWMNAAKSHKNKLQKVQNKALRIIYQPERKTKKLHKLADIETIDQFKNEQIIKFTNKLDQIPNKLINQIGRYTTYEKLTLENSKGRKYRDKLICLPSRTNLLMSPQRNL